MDDLLKSFPRYVTLPEWELRILMGTETHVKPKDVYSLLRHNRRIAAIQESIHKDGSRQARLEEIQNIIAERNANETQYDDSIVR